MAAKMLVRTVWLSVIIVQAAGFMAPTYTPLLRTSRGACDRVGIQMADDINTKKVAGALGGVLGNLRSGRGLFGEEATKKVARQALDIVEEQVQEVVEEIRADQPASSMKKSDKAKKMVVEDDEDEAPSKPVYTSVDKWDLTLASDPQSSLEVTVRPTQKAGLLLKAWAAEFPDKPAKGLRIPKGSWKPGAVDTESLIGESGILPDGVVIVETD